MSARRTAFVAGATGYVGSRLVPELVAQGLAVIAAGRSIDRLSAREWAHHDAVRLTTANVLRPETLQPALAGADVAYYLVHSMGGGNTAYAHDDIAGARNFAAACAAEGVSRIVYLSGLGSDSDQLSEHLQSRHDTGNALREAGVPVTELRAAVIIGSGSASFEIMRDLARKLPVMVTPAWVRTRCEPIAIRDVLFYLTAVLDEPRTIGQTLEIGCGTVYEYGEMLRVTAREYAGRGIAIIPVPVLTPRLSSWWLHLVTSVDVSLARELIEGMRNDVVCSDTRIAEWVPRDRLDLPTAVALAHRVEQRGSMPSRWADTRSRHPSEGPTTPPAKCFVDERTFESRLAPEDLFDRVASIGGARGYGRYQALWRLRATADRAIGGVGFRLGRPARPLRTGDAVDFWRVRTIDRPSTLVLEAEMRLPGPATLAFTITPTSAGARLTQRASMEDTGIAARTYWQLLQPVHRMVFTSLGEHLVAAERPQTTPGAP